MITIYEHSQLGMGFTCICKEKYKTSIFGTLLCPCGFKFKIAKHPIRETVVIKAVIKENNHEQDQN